MALSCEPQRLRGSTEAPRLQCQRLPEVDWNALWLVSCSALLDRAPRRLREAIVWTGRTGSRWMPR